MNLQAKRKNLLLLVFITLIFIVHRSLTLGFLFNKILRLDSLEWHTTTLANDLINGLVPLKYFINIKHWLNYTTSFQGGFLIDSVLYIPLGLIFGINIFSLRLLPLLYSLGAFLLFSIFILKLFSKRIFCLFSLMYIFSAPSFIRWSLISYSNHEGTVLHTIAIIFIYMFPTQFFKKKYINSMLAGFFSGISLYYNYSFLIALFSIGLTLLFRKKNMLYENKKAIVIFISFFVIGFSPWLIINYSTDFQGLYYPGGEQTVTFIAMFKNIFSSTHLSLRITQLLILKNEISPSFNYANIISNKIAYSLFKNLYVTTFLMGMFYLFFSSNFLRDLKKSILFIYIMSFFIIVVGSSFPLEHSNIRYWLPFYPFFYTTLAVFLGEKNHFQNSMLNKLFNSIKLFVFMLLLVIGIADTIKTFSFAHSLKMIASFKGQQYYFTGIEGIEEENIEDVNLFLRENNYSALQKSLVPKNIPILEGFRTIFSDTNQKTYLHYSALPFSLLPLNLNQLKNKLNYFLAKFSKAEWKLFLKGLGWGCGVKYRWNKQKVEDIIKKINLTSKEQNSIIEGYEFGLKLTEQKDNQRQNK